MIYTFFECNICIEKNNESTVIDFFSNFQATTQFLPHRQLHEWKWYRALTIIWTSMVPTTPLNNLFHSFIDKKV